MLASSETQGQQVGMTRYFWAKVYLKSITLTEPVSEGFVFLPADWPEKYRKPLCEVRAFEKAEERSFATFYITVYQHFYCSADSPDPKIHFEPLSLCVEREQRQPQKQQ